MAEIGNTLREARRRRDLDLNECEHATKIRAKYLMAMEEERFEVLPEPVFVRGMLRTYADHLGVDPAPLLEEYAALTAESQAHQPSAPHPGRSGLVTRPPTRRRGRGKGVDPRLVAFGLGALLVVAALVYLSRDPGRIDPTPALTTSDATTPVRSVPVVGRTQAPPPAPAPAFLVIMGNSDTPAEVQVHRVDAEGPIVFQGSLGRGERRRIRVDDNLWVHIAPGGGTVAARLDGRAVALPAGDAGTVVGRRGIVR